EVSLSATNTAGTTDAITYASNKEINSVAYTATVQRENNQGSPAPLEVAVTNRLPEITVTSVSASSGNTTVTFTTTSAHGLVVGNQIEVVAAAAPAWLQKVAVATAPS